VGPVIVTVTVNAALDVTYRVDDLVKHASNRVRAVATRAGGKGVNVARVLHALGHDVVATGLAGGATGEQIRAELHAAGVPEAFVAVAGQSRRTITVVDSDATVLLEPGPQVAAGEWAALQGRLEELLTDARAVVLSGSLPPGLPVDAYSELGRLAARARVPVVLDAAGDALARGLEESPAVVKPNAAELAGLTAGDPLTAARELQRGGAQAVVVSCGPDGLVAVTPDGCWRAVPPARIRGNPTGAGDAAVAALAAGLAGGTPWPQRLADAVALSAAAVAAPLAGAVDVDVYRQLRPRVQVAEADPREGAPCR
jgi:tagatose 6-phosphate kinase